MAGSIFEKAASLSGGLSSLLASEPGRLIVVLGVLVVLVPVLWSVFRKTKRLKIPIALADEMIKKERVALYCQNSRDVLVRGYEKYGNDIWGYDTPEGTRIVLPLHYMDELKSHKSLSFGEALNEFTYKRYTRVGALPDWAIKLFSAKFNPALGTQFPVHHATVQKEIEKRIPKTGNPSWKSFVPWEQILPLIAKMNVGAFLGSEAADNDEFVTIASTYIPNSIGYTFGLAQLPRFLLPVGYRFVPGYKALAKQFDDGAKYVRSMMEKKKASNLAPLSDPPSVFDHVNADGKYLDDIDTQMDIQFPLCAASIHTTTATIVQCLFDLAAHREVLPQLREEARQVLDSCGGQLTKQALSNALKLDSFIKEVQRFSSPDLTTFQRRALQDVILSNGFQIPKGSSIEVATGAINADKSIYDKPELFDPLRHYRKRMLSESNYSKYSVLSVNKEDLSWGFGRAACPGRFLAEMQIKMCLIEIFMKCDIKLPDKQARYPNLELRGQTLPSEEGAILLKRLSVDNPITATS